MTPPPIRRSRRAEPPEVPMRVTGQNVSETQFDAASAFASRLYGRVSLRQMRSHMAIRMFCAGLALAVREARRDPQTANAVCRRARVKGKRLEVRVTRLIVGRR